MLAATLFACSGGGGGGGTDPNSTYTVTYNGNNSTGGIVPFDSTNYAQGQTATVLENTGNLVNTGYSFVGWNTQANGTGTTYTPGQTFPIGTANVTLYAMWTTNPTYTVTYNGNGNTGGIAPVVATNYEQGQTVSVVGNTGNLVNTNYTFAGWNTLSNGTGTNYTAGQTFLMGTANVILYAKWTANPTYTVTYYGNGSTSGIVPVDSTNYEEGQTVTVLGNTGNLVNTNYTFEGWNTMSNGTGTTYTQGQTFTMGTANVNLYAMWTANTTYTVTYNGNGNTGGIVPVDSTNYEVGQTVTVLGNPGNLSKTNYAFEGWNTMSNGAGTTYTQGQAFTMGTANVTLYATWNATPPSPTNVQATAGNAQVTVSWVASAGVMSYDVFYSTSSAVSTTSYADLITTTTTSAIASGLTNGTTYYFIVTAINGTVSSAASSPTVSATPSAPVSYANLWTWMSGTNTINQFGNYGTKGTAAPTNLPGARYYASSWIDSSGNFWLFGGYGYDAGGLLSTLNDLWKFDGTNWTWVSGANFGNNSGIYGSFATAAPTNMPGARYGAVSWIDSSGNLWLFGGLGYDAGGNHGQLNDLWKFDGTNWTWESGYDVYNSSGSCGTEGTAAGNNIPGARYGAVSWIDSGGNLWLLGGKGFDCYDDIGYLNDLWRYDGTDWTWVSGASYIGQYGVYGTMGTAAGTNIPGARAGDVSWIDSSGNFWLFGGYGVDFGGVYGDLNDLWKFDGKMWTWMTGTTTTDQVGNYGTMGTAATTNIPGARDSATTWIDSSGNLWLFGGEGTVYATGDLFGLSDLWKFDGTNWTWVSGADTTNQLGTYGKKGTPAITNVPGARFGAAPWIDSSGNLWLFGGYGYDYIHGPGQLNDLWRYEP